MSHFHQLTNTQPAHVEALNLPPNLSCVLLKKRTISVEATPLPILQPDGVLVKIIATDESLPLPENSSFMAS
ncbi:hypothetical protein P7C73_g201, partial [Tremellales sp. Uapishka_1]